MVLLSAVCTYFGFFVLRLGAQMRTPCQYTLLNTNRVQPVNIHARLAPP